MRKPKLLLQLDVFSEDELQDSRTIIEKYFEVTTVADQTIHLDRNVKWEGPFRGSLFLAHLLKSDLRWTDALNFLPELRQFSVHKDYFFLDMKELLQRDAVTWPKFVRPCSGKKTFSGNVYTKEKLQNEATFLIQNKNVDNVMCLVSEPQTLLREWRCIFVNNQFCSGSQYMLNGELDLVAEVPNEVKAFARKVGEHPYFLNRFEFVIDVAETSNGLKLIEINAFPTSSFYLADLDLVYATYAKQFHTLRNIKHTY